MASNMQNSLGRYWEDAVLPDLLKTYVGEDISLPTVLIALSAIWLLFVLTKSTFGKKRRDPPAVPGLPILGNLLQLGEKKPHKSFTAWSEKYGPIFTIRTGAVTMVVISSSEIAKEAMVTNYSSISSRKLSTAISILSCQKTMVAMSDYGDEHRMLKKLVVNHLLGSTPQRENRALRESASYKMLDEMYSELEQYPGSVGRLNVREFIKKALFPFSMYQVLGRDPDSVFVKEMGRDVSRWEMFNILVMDAMKAAIEVDWRDFFPALKWVPYKAVEDKAKELAWKRAAVIRALIAEQRQLLANGKQPNCFLDTLLTEATHLSEKQLEMSTWEPIIESADTTLVTIEWAMYEIAKQPKVQERLYKELKDVAGQRIVKEDDIPKLPYLDAIIKETLRKYPPVPLLPPRYVEEDVQLGGFDIKKGCQIILNLYGINNNSKIWPNPEVWDPERVLGDAKLDLGFKDYRILPFGAGKRICAGITQAMYVIPMNIAYYVQHFKWSLPVEENNGVVDTVFLTSHKLHPLEAVATPREPKRLEA